ncbi:hypothetical protein [Thermodesulfobacterium sp. TA1]|nr:hypothetical protein [Thermodesulfobacterium sp. TA1]
MKWRNESGFEKVEKEIKRGTMLSAVMIFMVVLIMTDFLGV